jgi:hypothetical protein
VIVVAFAFLFFQGKKVITPSVDQYFQAMDTQDYDAVYDMLSEGWHALRSREETAEHLRHIRESLGRCEKRRIISARLNYENAAATADVLVQAEFEQGPGAVQILFVYEENGWRIDQLHYEAAPLRDTVPVHLTERAAPQESASRLG